METLRQDDLRPDGVRIVVDWDRMRPGDYVFIPCLNYQTCALQADAIAARRGWQIVRKPVVRYKMLGLAVWRTT